MHKNIGNFIYKGISNIYKELCVYIKLGRVYLNSTVI